MHFSACVVGVQCWPAQGQGSSSPTLMVFGDKVLVPQFWLCLLKMVNPLSSSFCSDCRYYNPSSENVPSKFSQFYGNMYEYFASPIYNLHQLEPGKGLGDCWSLFQLPFGGIACHHRVFVYFSTLSLPFGTHLPPFYPILCLHLLPPCCFFWLPIKEK